MIMMSNFNIRNLVCSLTNFLDLFNYTNKRYLLEAAADLHKDPQGFASRVRTAMKGGLVNGISFDNVMA